MMYIRDVSSMERGRGRWSEGRLVPCDVASRVGSPRRGGGVDEARLQRDSVGDVVHVPRCALLSIAAQKNDGIPRT